MRRGPKPAKSGEAKPPDRDLEKRLTEALKGKADALRDKAEAQDQQTATSEILRVISSSPMDAQPVFDTIAERAMRLCAALVGAVFRFDGELIHLVAVANVSSEGAEALRSVYPMPPSSRSTTGRAVLTGDSAAILDVFDDPDYGIAREAETSGFRSVVSVPMLRDGRPIGAVSVGRAEPGSFSERQIELLKTFADQAVIAIENVRLFKELQEKNRALTQAHAQVSEALDQQTATSDILRVISSSPTDLQPVFDAIVRSAQRLVGAHTTSIFRGLAARGESHYSEHAAAAGKYVCPTRACACRSWMRLVRAARSSATSEARSSQSTKQGRRRP